MQAVSCPSHCMFGMTQSYSAVKRKPLHGLHLPPRGWTNHAYVSGSDRVLPLRTTHPQRLRFLLHTSVSTHCPDGGKEGRGGSLKMQSDLVSRACVEGTRSRKRGWFVAPDCSVTGQSKKRRLVRCPGRKHIRSRSRGEGRIQDRGNLGYTSIQSVGTRRWSETAARAMPPVNCCPQKPRLHLKVRKYVWNLGGFFGPACCRRQKRTDSSPRTQ